MPGIRNSSKMPSGCPLHRCEQPINPCFPSNQKALQLQSLSLESNVHPHFDPEPQYPACSEVAPQNTKLQEIQMLLELLMYHNFI